MARKAARVGMSATFSAAAGSDGALGVGTARAFVRFTVSGER
jgi:hypothetical protein